MSCLQLLFSMALLHNFISQFTAERSQTIRPVVYSYSHMFNGGKACFNFLPSITSLGLLWLLILNSKTHYSIILQNQHYWIIIYYFLQVTIKYWQCLIYFIQASNVMACINFYKLGWNNGNTFFKFSTGLLCVLVSDNQDCWAHFISQGVNNHLWFKIKKKEEKKKKGKANGDSQQLGLF